MSELSPEARALVEREREQSGPTSADRARMRAKLEPAWAALRAGQPVATSPAAQPTAAQHSLRLSRVMLNAVVLSFGFLSSEAPRNATAALESTWNLPSSAAMGRTATEHDSSIAHTARDRLSAGLTAEGVLRSHAAARTPLERPPSETRDEAAHRRLPVLAKGAALTQRPAAPAHVRTPSGASGKALPSASSAGNNQPDRANQTNQTAAAAQEQASTADRVGTAPPFGRARARSATAIPKATGRPTSDAISTAPDLRTQDFVPEAIDDELSWLGAAQEALRRHEPTRALKLVQEHAFRFPRGALAQERRAVQVLALCALQRKQAARAVLQELEQHAPSSPLVVGIRRSCGL